MFVFDMSVCLVLTLPMLRLLSSKAQGRNDFLKPSEPCHGGIHLILSDQMSTHMCQELYHFAVVLFFASFLYWPL